MKKLILLCFVLGLSGCRTPYERIEPIHSILKMPKIIAEEMLVKPLEKFEEKAEKETKKDT